MYIFENCRLLGKSLEVRGTLYYIDNTYDAMYWINRQGQTLFAIATDREGNKYKVYRNDAKGLGCAIKTEE